MIFAAAASQPNPKAFTSSDARPSVPHSVVIRSGVESVSLLVDRVGDVIEIDDDRFVEVPITVGAAISTRTTGAYKLDGNLLLVLDPDDMLAVAS